MDDWSQDEWKRRLDAQGTRMWEEAYERLGQYLFVPANRLTDWDDQRAQDLVQETLKIVLEEYPRFEWRSHVKTWAVAILRNVARGRWGASKREELDPMEPESRPDPGTGPEDEAIESDLLLALRHCFTQLSDREQQAIRMRLRGRPASEIAAALGIEECYVTTLNYRARRKLRQCMQSAGWESASVEAKRKQS